MSNIPITSLPLAISLDGSEAVPIVQAGTTKRTTIGAIANTATGFVPESREIITPTAGGLTGGGTLASNLTLQWSAFDLLPKTAMVVADSFAINDSALNGPAKVTFPNAMKAIPGLTALSFPNLLNDYLIINHAADGLTYKINPSSLGLAAGNVPAGGTTGQMLAKASNTNYDTVWQNSALTLNALSIAANPTGLTASSISVTLGSTLAFSGTALQTAALTGDVTAGANSFVTTVAKIQGTVVSGTTGSTNVVFSNSPSLVTPALGVATATSLAIGGATLGSDALAVTGSTTISSTVTGGTFVPTLNSIPTDGMYLNAAGQVAFAAGSTRIFFINSAGLLMANASGATLSSAAATAIAPTVIPRRSDSGTGIGSTSTASLSLIATSVEQLRVNNGSIYVGGAATGTNTAAVAPTISGALSTGTATNPDLVFQTGVKTTSGTGQATATTALTIKGETQVATFASAVIFGTTVGGTTILNDRISADNGASFIQFNGTNTGFGGNGLFTASVIENGAVGFVVAADRRLGWSASNASSSAPASADTGLSRLSAATVGLGNGTQGDISGALQLASVSNGSSQGKIQFSSTNVGFGGNNLVTMSILENGAFGVSVAADRALGFSSANASSSFPGAPDTAFSRDSAGVLDLGTGATGSKAGSLNLTNLTATGTVVSLSATAIPVGGTAGSGYKFSSTSNYGLFFGSGAPTLSAAQGSLYLRNDGIPYYNTNGTTGWTALAAGGIAITSLTGDVTGTGPGATATTIAANAVTYAKFQQVAASSLVGNATGSLANATGITIGATLAFSGSALQTAAFTGDATTSANSFALTLATVNSNVGSFGTATQTSQFTVNGKGLITAAANVTVTPAVGSITGLGTGVATALAVNVGSAGAFVTFNGALGTPSSGTLTSATGLPLTTGVTGQLPLANGGTAANLTASNGGIFYSTASAGAILSGTATANQLLTSGSSAAPSWTTATYPATAAAGTMLAAASSNTIAATATPTLGANSGTGGQITFNGSTSGTCTLNVQAAAGTGSNFTLPNTNGSSGNVLSTNGSGVTSWIAVGGTGTVTSIDVSGGTTGLTTSGGPVVGAGTITLAGTLVVSNGGTGRTSLTNHGVIVGAGTSAVTQLAAAAAGTVLGGLGSSSDPAFTAVPVLGVAGATVGTIGFQNATSGTITLSPPTGALGTVTLTLPAATDTLVGKATTDTLTNKTLTSPTLTTPVLGTPSSGTLTNCTGLPVAGGGTGVASLTAYAVICGGTTTTGAVQSIASVGTSGQVLTSNGAGALPTFQTASAGGQPIPANATFAVGTLALCLNTSGSSVTNGSTIAGSSLQLAHLHLSAAGCAGNFYTVSSGGAQTGTWTNVTGATIAASSVDLGYFVRTA